jgi:hypothetical protein
MRFCAFAASFLAPSLLTFAMGCGSGAELAQPTVPQAAGATIEFEFDPGVSPEDQALVEETIAESRQFYASELGRDLKRDITAKVLAEDGGPYLGYSYGRTAWIFTGGEYWPRSSSLDDVIRKKQLIAHELFHNFQWDLMYTDDAIPSDSEWWVLEGSAEYVSARYLADRYEIDWDFLLLSYSIWTETDLPSLNSDGRDIAHFDGLYNKAFLAIEQLMRGRPLSVFADYFEATGRHEWEDAFIQVFAISPNDFVAQFEAGPE